jgi:hypothetical protein
MRQGRGSAPELPGSAPFGAGGAKGVSLRVMLNLSGQPCLLLDRGGHGLDAPPIRLRPNPHAMEGLVIDLRRLNEGRKALGAKLPLEALRAFRLG